MDIDMANFDPLYVAVRSRALLFADECRMAHLNALAFPPCRGNGRGQIEDHNVCGRAAMKAEGIPVCSAIDDMAAVVPQHLAQAYFLRPQTLQQHVPPELLPEGWNMSQREEYVDSVRFTFGRNMTFQRYREVCVGVAKLGYIGGPEVNKTRQTTEWRSTVR